MGCNCKATEHILKIHKKYGNNISTPWKERITFHTAEIIKTILAFFLGILFFPIFLVILLFYSFNGKTVIDVNKILNKLLRHNKK